MMQRLAGKTVLHDGCAMGGEAEKDLNLNPAPIDDVIYSDDTAYAGWGV
jgi:hypothetical protein